jgi:hypothetical protein
MTSLWLGRRVLYNAANPSTAETAMTVMNTKRRARRTLLLGVGAAAAGVALGASPVGAATQAASAGGAPGSTPTFTPARHKEDEWLDALPGKHRVFIDTASVESASEGLLYAGNLFTANRSGYALADGDIATVVCFRHYSTIFAYNNAMWEKYGKTIADSSKYVDPKSAEPPKVNPLREIETLARRGVHFAICGLATRRIAGQIASATGSKTDEIQAELIANVVSNGHVMAAGVVATTRAQEYGYSLLVAG